MAREHVPAILRAEEVMEQAGLTICARGDVSCPFEYPDDETAWKTISSSGPLVAAIRAAGEETIKQAVLTSLAEATGRRISSIT